MEDASELEALFDFCAPGLGLQNQIVFASCSNEVTHSVSSAWWLGGRGGQRAIDGSLHEHWHQETRFATFYLSPEDPNKSRVCDARMSPLFIDECNVVSCVFVIVLKTVVSGDSLTTM